MPSSSASGSQERFTASVASVLDEALARAEVEKHTQVAGAIAPLVVSTIRTEIRNSQDELAEALYPGHGPHGEGLRRQRVPRSRR